VSRANNLASPKCHLSIFLASDLYRLHRRGAPRKLFISKTNIEFTFYGANIYKENGKFARYSRNNLSVISFSMECPEAVERGRNFRLLAEEELSKLLDFLTGYLPESLKVRTYIFSRLRLFTFYYS